MSCRGDELRRAVAAQWITQWRDASGWMCYNLLRGQLWRHCATSWAHRGAGQTFLAPAHRPPLRPPDIARVAPPSLAGGGNGREGDAAEMATADAFGRGVLDELLMSSCAGLMKLHLAELPFPKMDFKPLPYLSKWQEDDKFDGELEGCRKDPEKRRALIPVQAPFIDARVQRRLDSMEPDGQGKKKELSICVSDVQLAPLPFVACRFCWLCLSGL